MAESNQSKEGDFKVTSNGSFSIYKIDNQFITKCNMKWLHTHERLLREPRDRCKIVSEETGCRRKHAPWGYSDAVVKAPWRVTSYPESTDRPGVLDWRSYMYLDGKPL